MASIFADIANKTFDKQYHAELLVYELHGGIPADANKATGWIASKMGLKDDMLRDMVVKTMEERGTVEAATSEDITDAAGEIADLKQLNGFKRDDDDGLYIEGRQVKAMLKEAASIAVASAISSSGIPVPCGIIKSRSSAFICASAIAFSIAI